MKDIFPLFKAFKALLDIFTDVPFIMNEREAPLSLVAFRSFDDIEAVSDLSDVILTSTLEPSSLPIESMMFFSALSESMPSSPTASSSTIVLSSPPLPKARNTPTPMTATRAINTAITAVAFIAYPPIYT